MKNFIEKSEKRKIIAFLLLSLLLVPIVGQFLFPKVEAAGEGWLTGWDYRRLHNITGSSAGAQTDYPVEVTIYYEPPSWYNFASNGVSQPTYGILNYPSAIYYNGVTYIVWQGGDNTLDPYIISYTHATETWSSIVKVGENPLTEDDHGDPSLYIDANGYLHVFFGCHYTAGERNIQHAKSDNPEDVSTWTDQADVVALDPTYPKPVGNGSDVWLIYRSSVGAAQATEVYRESNDNGATWGAETTILGADASHLVYCGGVELYNDSIHIAWTVHDLPAGDDRYDIFHAYLNLTNDKMYSMDGTDLGASITTAEADANCMVIDTGTYGTDIPSMHLDSSGNPYMIYTVDSVTGWSWNFVYWNGTDWVGPQTITLDADNKYNFADLIINSPTNIEAFLTTSGGPGRGGDIERWTYDGTDWTKAEVILTEAKSGEALNWCYVPLNFIDELKMVFIQSDVANYTNTDLKLYAYGSAFEQTVSGDEVILNGKCKADFGDIRFTESDGISELVYGFKSTLNGSRAVARIITDIPISPNNETIYMYYGKADATTTSDLTATYIFWDDFDDNSLNTTKWDDKSYAGGVVTEQNDRLELSIIGTNRGAMVASDNAFDISNTEIKVSLASPVEQGAILGLCLTSPAGDPYSETDWYRFYLYQTTDTFAITRKVADVPVTPYNAAWIDSENTVKITYDGTTIKIYEGETLRLSEAYLLGSNNVYFLLYHATGANVGAGTVWVDSLYVSKWVDPEPVSIVWGDEESAPWLTGWTYRRSHVFENATGAGTLYQKKVTVHYTDMVYNLTILNERSDLVFTIGGNTGWTERDFGSVVPADTIVAFCMFTGTTWADVALKSESGITQQTAFSIGNDVESFDGAIFVLVPVKDQKVWTYNVGSTGDVGAYVVGYIREQVTGDGFYFEMFDQDEQVITTGVATDWTDIDISALKVENGDFTIQGAYIALSCATDQSVYFRAKGSSDDGVLWEPDTSDPGTHLMGIIPVNSDGIFQYKTGGNAINVYVEGLIHDAPASMSDNVAVYLQSHETTTLISDSTWHTYVPAFAGKIYSLSGQSSPAALNTFTTRPKGGSNAQIKITRDSCGSNNLLTAIGDDDAVQYWSNAASNGNFQIGGVTIFEGGGQHVYLDEKCKTDFGDIRFTDNDGTTELDYWMEEKVDSDYAVFWVEVADDLSTSPVTIYLYYGKDDATTTKNGDNTFLEFDDFEDDTIGVIPSDWTESENPAQGSTLTTASGYSGQGVELICTSAVYRGTKGIDLTVIYVVELRYKGAAGMGEQVLMGGAAKEYHLGVSESASADFRYLEKTGVWKATGVTKDDDWHKLKYFVKETPSTFVLLLSGVELSGEIYGTDNNVTEWGTRFQATGTIVLDELFARKYTDPEPVSGAWGAEEEYEAPPDGEPTITSATITDMDNSDNSYEMESYYSFVVVVRDPDGATDIDMVYLQGTQVETVRFEVRATDLTGAGAWAIQTGGEIIDLDTGNCVWSEDGNEGTATFKIRFEWDFTDEADLELRVYVEDLGANSTGFTTKQTDYFDVIGRLVTSNLAAADGRINKNSATTFSGDVRYATTVSGDTASAKYPPDAQFTAVHIHDSSHASKGNDASIVNGAFSGISVTVPDAVQSNTYHVYLDMAGDYTDADAPDGDTAAVIGDALKCTAFTRDVANQKLYVRMLYAFDSTAAESGTVSFVGISGTANSEGWAEIALSVASNFDWGEEAYGITDAVFDITATSENQTITLAKYGQLIGGNAEVDDTSTWNGVSLVLDYSLGLGDYYTEIVTTTPSYIYNVAYDLENDLSGGLLNLTHDGSMSITMARQSWSGTFVQAVPSGYLASATMADNILTLNVSSATSVTDVLIVDCTGRGSPQETTGFDSTPLYLEPDLTGPYTTNVILTVDWRFGSSSGEPGEVEPGGDVGGIITVLTTYIPSINLIAIQGEPNGGVFDITWSSPVTSITVRIISFLDQTNWFEINGSAPFRLEDLAVSPEKKDSLSFTVTPDADARIGDYTIPVEFQLAEGGAANTVIYLSVIEPITVTLPPSGIPDVVGIMIGIGFLVAIGITLIRRSQNNGGGGRFRV